MLCSAFISAANAGGSRTIDNPYQVGMWPEFRQAAVSYTFDDACPNQFTTALPMFDEFDFKATMFIVTNWSPNWPALKSAALKGHEIASHTVSHPTLDKLNIEQQTTELKNSQETIDAQITNQKCLTLAYPYCALGDKQSCEKYYIAARGCQGFIEPNTPKDFMNISSVICGSSGSVKTTADFNDRIDNAAKTNGWCVFLIHGIDNDNGYSPLPSAVLKESLKYIDANKNKIWIDTFGNVVKYIRERNDVTVKEISNQENKIILNITDTLDNSIYNFPITIRRPLPANWKSASALQNGKTIPIAIVTVDSAKYVSFDVVPDNGEIEITKN